MKTIIKLIVSAMLLAIGALSPAMAGQFVLVNTDGPGVGFNDPTPATPVGGNNGTTVGQQRLIAYSRALQLWGSILKSDVPVVVLGSFQPRSCTPTTGVLASAGAWNIELNFPGAPLPGHWYHGALANAIAGADLYPGVDVIDGADIVAIFNSELGTPACLTSSRWYYGLDNDADAAAGEIDFLDTFMHELSHGLGFSNFVNEATGAVAFAGTPFAAPDVYMANTLDNATGLRWNQMTAAQIVAAAIRDGQEVWAGTQVTTNAPAVLDPATLLQLTAPAALAGEYEFGRAAFGATATPANFGGAIVIGQNLDGCAPLTNAAAVAGKIALLRRGTCTFAVKAKNAQNAGAIGVIIANNAPGGPPGLGGADPTVTIPVISIDMALGNAFIAANVVGAGSLVVSTTRLAGADAAGRVRLYAPGVVALGSSISHYDIAADPNLLMEPAITNTLHSATSVDLTTALFEDIGWKTELSIAGCGAGSGAIAGDNTGEYYAGPVFSCANTAGNHGNFQSCATHYLNELRDVGVIGGKTTGTLKSCAASGK